MISAGDFRNGKTLEIEGTVYQILEFQHVKPGKGAAFVRTKLKNIKNGGILANTSPIKRTFICMLESDCILYTLRGVTTFLSR